MISVKCLSDLNKALGEECVAVRGKIVKIRKLGKLIFAILRDQTGRCQLVFENVQEIEVQKGDFVTVQGILCMYEGRLEIHVDKYEILGSSNSRDDVSEISAGKMDKLILRSVAMQSVGQFMQERMFLPVTSPTIVGSWVEGNTATFEVDYYGTKKYLTLNSMLYHQVMLISGYNRIYEFSKIFRKDTSSVRDRLSEFVSLDISMSGSDKYGMMSLVEDMIYAVMEDLSVRNICGLIPNITFERISFQELMDRSGCRTISGAQLSAKARAYLNDNYKSFVWVYGFPEEKRRFFVKSTDGICQDYQLWYRGDHQVASGGERETDLAVMRQKIENEGKQLEDYEGILRYFENGVPPMCEIGFGFERFMLDITESDRITDFVAFPRNKNTDF